MALKNKIEKILLFGSCARGDFDEKSNIDIAISGGNAAEFCLMINGYLPISVSKEDRLGYYNVLESYATTGNLSGFAEFVAELEEMQLDDFLKIK